MKIPLSSASGLETVLEKVGRSLSERFGIRVICRGNDCCTNGRTIFLPALPDELPPAMLQIIRGYLDHETGHLVGKSNFRILKWFREKYGADASQFLNMLEDLRVEEVMRQRFPGSKKNLAAAYDFLAEEAGKSVEPVPAWRQLAFGIHARGNRLPAPPFVGTEVLQALDMIRDAVLKTLRCRGTKEVARLAEAAWPVVSQLFPPPKPAPAPAEEPADQNQQGVQQPPERSTTAEGNATGPDDGTEAQSDDLTGADEQDNAAAADIMRDLSGAITDMVNRYAQTSRAYRVWTTQFDTVTTAHDTGSVPHHQRMVALLPHVAGVRQKLLQTLLAEPKARWLGDKDAGKINPRALHSLAVSKAESSGNARIFRERVRTRRIHTAVTLLLDQSGSMNGRKMILAKNTALVFCEALSRLDISCCVVGFGTGDTGQYNRSTVAKSGMSYGQLMNLYRIAPLRHIVFKHFHESFRAVSGRFDSMQPLLATPLGESVLLAARGLAGRHEERKVLLVLTDGRPEVGLGDDSATFRHAKDSIKRAERAGIDVALVGILDQRVTDLHHRSVVVNSLDELPKTVMRQLHSLLTNNHRNLN